MGTRVYVRGVEQWGEIIEVRRDRKARLTGYEVRLDDRRLVVAAPHEIALLPAGHRQEEIAS